MIDLDEIADAIDEATAEFRELQRIAHEARMNVSGLADRVAAMMNEEDSPWVVDAD